MAHGRQYVSWIHADDFCRALDWLIATPQAQGVYNICAPEPLANAEMMAVLRRSCPMPVGLPAPRWLLEIAAWIIRTETELIIKSRRVIPDRLQAEGFTFDYPTFAQAVAQLTRQS